MSEQSNFEKKKQAIKYLRWGIVFLLMLGMVNSYFDRMNMSFAASSISREFGRWVQIFKFKLSNSFESQNNPVDMTNENAIIGGGMVPANDTQNSLAYFLHREDTSWTLAPHFELDSISHNEIIARAVALNESYAAIATAQIGSGARTVYVLKFKRSETDSTPGQWELQTTLQSPQNEAFGSAIALDGDQLIVGAPSSSGRTGAAYIFQNRGDEWRRTTQLQPEAHHNRPQFGHSVGITNEYAMVGLPGFDQEPGKVFVFKKENNCWEITQQLTAKNGFAGDQFGYRLAIDGEYAIISASPSSPENKSMGSVYAFKQMDGKWEFHNGLEPQNGIKIIHWGDKIDLRGNYAIIGARTQGASSQNIALIFHREGKRWNQEAVLTPDETEKISMFGSGVALNAKDNVLVSGKLPDTQEEIAIIFKHYPLDPAKMGFILAMFFWAYGIMQVPAGRLVDKFGIRKLYTTSFFIWAFVATAFGLATSIWMFILLRALLGILESVSAPASMAFIGRYFDEKERGLATGIYLAGTKLGPSIGGILAAWLIGTYGWRMLFILCGLVPLIWLFPWEYYYRILEKRLRERDSKTIDDKVAVDASTKKKLIPLKLIFRYKKTWGVFWGSAAYAYVLVLYLSWLPTYFREQMHFSLTKMGAFSGIAFGGVALMVPLAGAAADFLIRKGWDTSKVRKGFIIAGFFMGALIIPVPFISHPDYAVTVLLIAIVSMGMATANTWAIMQAIAPENTIGTLAGVQNLGGSVGSAVAPLLTGFMVSASGTFKSAFILAGIIMLSGILNYVFLIGKVERIQIK